jgi:uncharacterized integral membrane protein
MSMRNDRPEPGDGEGKGLGGGPSIATIAWILVALGLAVLILQNGDRVTINFLFLDFRTREWVLILISMALGALLGWLLPRILLNRDKDKS